MNLTSFNETKHRVFHLMQSGDELHAIVIRNAEILTQDAADLDGVAIHDAWLALEIAGKGYCMGREQC